MVGTGRSSRGFLALGADHVVEVATDDIHPVVRHVLVAGDEIADQLGVSPNTVKSRLYNALDKLKGELGVNYV